MKDKLIPITTVVVGTLGILSTFVFTDFWVAFSVYAALLFPLLVVQLCFIGLVFKGMKALTTPQYRLV